MQEVLTAEEMQNADEKTIKQLKINSKTLMERAGLGIFEILQKTLKEQNLNKAYVFCGAGNNGGDGYVVAKKCFDAGYDVTVIEVGEPKSEDCKFFSQKYNGKRIIINSEKDLQNIFDCSEKNAVIVDAIFGTGLNKEVKGLFLKAIKLINQSKNYKIACDIPSGLNGTNGLKMGEAVIADLTVAVQFLKSGHVLNDGIDVCGKIQAIDVGIKNNDFCGEVLSDEDIKHFFEKRPRNSHKGSFGTATSIAGSKKYSGASMLTYLSLSATYMGCGYSKLCVVKSLFNAVNFIVPDSILCFFKQTFNGKFKFNKKNLDTVLNSNAISFGMGVGVTLDNYKIIEYLLLNYEKTLILDADALNTLSKYGVDIIKNRKCKLILTPHIKEFSRLVCKTVSEIQQNPIVLANKFAKEYNVTLLLKSAVSIICDGDRLVYNVRGTSGLAKGGSGDVLSGLICGLSARGLSDFDSASVGSYLLGVAGEIAEEKYGEYSMTATDVLKEIHTIIKNLN